jgi:hypothetical protein
LALSTVTYIALARTIYIFTVLANPKHAWLLIHPSLTVSGAVAIKGGAGYSTAVVGARAWNLETNVEKELGTTH